MTDLQTSPAARVPARPRPASGNARHAVLEMPPKAVGSGGWAAVTLFVAMSAAAAPLLVTRASGVGSVPMTTWLLQLLIVTYAGLRLGRLVLGGQPQWMALLFWVYVYIWLGLAPLAQVAARFNPLQVTQDPLVVQEAAGVVIVGLLAYDTGQWLAQRKPLTPGRFERRQISPRRIRLLGLFALVTAPYFIAKLGGLGVLLTSRQAAASSLTNTGLITGTSKSTYAIVLALATVPPFLALLGLWIERSPGLRTSRSSLPTLALMLALVVSNALLNNPISNPRYWVLSIVLAFVIVGRRAARPTFVRGVIVGLLLAGVVVFPYLDYFRYTDHQGGQAGPLTELVQKTDYDSMAQIQNGVLFAKERGHTDGGQMLGAALFWVPRTVWANKPEDTGTVLANFINFPNTNLSAPLWVESWLDFSWVGLIGVLGSLGYVSRRLDLYFQAARKSGRRSMILLVVPVLAGYQVLVLRGSLLQSMSRLAMLLLVMAAISARPRKQSRTQR